MQGRMLVPMGWVARAALGPEEVPLASRPRAVVVEVVDKHTPWGLPSPDVQPVASAVAVGLGSAGRWSPRRGVGPAVGR